VIHKDTRIINLETGTIEAFEATEAAEHESKHLPDLLKNIDDIECFVADSPYLSRRKR
jgi:IS5 family transposase